MINIIYFGIGTFDEEEKTADYSIVLPELRTGNYEFPAIYNFTKNGDPTILIHMQIAGVSPDPDLACYYRNYQSVEMLHQSFNLKNIDYVNSPESTELSLKGNEVSVILYHDDEFDMAEARQTYYENRDWKDKFTQPKKAGYGILKPKLKL